MSAIPSPYRMFFLYVEPIVIIVVAFYAAFKPTKYLGALSLGASSVQPTPTYQTTIALEQLGNVFLYIALNEYLVLSSTESITTWKCLLLAFLVADCGHLSTMRGLGAQAYWRTWNAFTATSVFMTYFTILLRICFLLDVGMGEPRKVKSL